MDTSNALRLFVVALSIGGVVYACVGTGAFSSEQTNWWAELPQRKKVAFGAAIAATLLQSFI
jgi:hypothetical protein